MKIYDIENLKPFNFLENLYLFFIEIILSLKIILLFLGLFLVYGYVNSFPVTFLSTTVFILVVLFSFSAIVVFIPFYDREKQIDKLLKPDTFINEAGKAVDASPIPVLPVSEIFRTSKSLKNLKLFGESVYDSSSVMSFGNLKEPHDYFALIQNVAYKPEQNSVFNELLDNLPKAPDLRVIYIPFLTDFASIPFGQKTGSYTRAAVVHDWGYSFHPERNYTGRKECDLEMLNIMRKDGTPAFARSYIYLGLRLFGTYSFMTAPIRRKKLVQITQNEVFLNQFFHALSSQFIFTAILYKYKKYLTKITPEDLQNDIEASIKKIKYENNLPK